MFSHFVGKVDISMVFVDSRCGKNLDIIKIICYINKLNILATISCIPDTKSRLSDLKLK